MIRYDSRGVKPSQFSDPVPAGNYILQIIKTEEKMTSKGLPMIKMTCTVQAPSEFSGAAVFHNVTIIPKGEPGAGIAIHFLKTIGQPFEEDEALEINPEAWVYGTFLARIIQEPYTKPDGTRIITNKIKGVDVVPEGGIPF